jgi:type IV secretory pathway VirB6-like protein
MAVIPFLLVVLQWALVLPLAPIMLLFSFFKFTEEYFKNWMKFCISKSVELFVFFTAFYFWTGIINNKIREGLYFQVCVDRLSSFIINVIRDIITGEWEDIVNVILLGGITVSIIMAIVYKIYKGSTSGGRKKKDSNPYSWVCHFDRDFGGRNTLSISNALFQNRGRNF